MVRPLTTGPADAPRRPWREGVESRLHGRGAASLCVLEQWSAPGAGAPTHAHHEEELIIVVAGAADFWVDGVGERVGEGGSILVPAGSWHGYRNAGFGELHTLAVFPSARPTVEYEVERGTVLEIAERHQREEESP